MYPEEEPVSHGDMQCLIVLAFNCPLSGDLTSFTCICGYMGAWPMK